MTAHQKCEENTLFSQMLLTTPVTSFLTCIPSTGMSIPRPSVVTGLVGLVQELFHYY